MARIREKALEGVGPQPAQPTKTWSHARIYQSVTVSPPPSRMAVAVVTYQHQEGGQPVHEGGIVPVVGIQTVVYTEYQKYSPDGEYFQARSVRHDDLVGDGWTLASRGTSLEHDLLVIGDPYGTGTPMVCPLEEEVSKNTVGQRIVLCSWPLEEDRDRFEPIFRDIIAHPDANGLVWCLIPDVKAD